LLVLRVGDRTSGVSMPSVMVFFGAFIDASRNPWRRADKVQEANALHNMKLLRSKHMAMSGMMGVATVAYGRETMGPKV
jgi:hypothetical protein